MPARLLFAATTLMLMLTPLFRGTALAATVKPLEVFSEKILVLEIEHLATEHSLNSALLRRSVDRLNREMNIMSKATAGESFKLLTDVSEKLSVAVKSSESLSRYLTTNSSTLKGAGHGQYLPLAVMDREMEGDYFKTLASFLKTAFSFVQFCHDNLDAVSSGSEAESKRYKELYASYLQTMEIFNSQSIARSQLLAEMGSQYPTLWELMPR
jgi:hypothetical protein